MLRCSKIDPNSQFCKTDWNCSAGMWRNLNFFENRQKSPEPPSFFWLLWATTESLDSVSEGEQRGRGGQNQAGREFGGMVVTHFEGNLEPINLGNFLRHGSERHGGSVWLAARHTFVSASSLWCSQSPRTRSSCCFKLSCPEKKESREKKLCRPIGADGWEGSWDFHGSPPLKSLIVFTRSHGSGRDA